MNKIFAPFLPPWVETGLQPAFYDMESGTVLQQTARMYAKVQQLTRLFNEFSEDVSNEVNNFERDINETVQEYIDKFVALKDFVEDYFDNLDVQEEINNKLDAMVEDGTFAEVLEPLIAQYEEELKDFEKLVNWENVEYTKERDEVAECDYYITEFPLNNPYGGKNIVRVGLANDDTTISSVEYPKDFAYRHKSPMVMNAGIFYSNSPTPTAYGLVIKDGVVLKNEAVSDEFYRDIIAIKENGDMKSYPVGTNPQVIINDGYVDAIIGFYVLIEDGNLVDYSGYADIDARPRNIICRKTNGDYLIFTCDGRTFEDKGMTLAQAADILTARGDIDFAFCLDGGGSTSTVVKGTKINKNIDSYGKKDRKVATMLYITSTNYEVYDMIGKINNDKQLEEAQTALKYRQLPFINNYFSGNLFDCYADGIQTNKWLGEGGVVTDYNNTTGSVTNDVMLSDYFQVPANEYIYCVNSRDFSFICFYDEDKNFLFRVNYKDNEHLEQAFRIDSRCAYARICVRRDVLTTCGVYVGDTYVNHHELYKFAQPKVLFENPNGAISDIEIGYTGQYYKLKIYTIDSSLQQYSQEVSTNCSGNSIWTVFSRVQTVGTTESETFSSRITIAKETGALSIDREYHVTVNANDESVTIYTDTDRIKITKIEATI